MRLLLITLSLFAMLTLLSANYEERPDIQLAASLNISTTLQVAWSADASLFAVLTGPTIEIWDAQAWRYLHTISDVYAYEMKWHPTQNILATTRGGQDERVLIWDGNTGDLKQEIVHSLPDGSVGIMVMRALSWHPQGTQIVTDGSDTLIRLWDLETNTSEALDLFPEVIGMGHGIIDLEWSSNGLLGVGDETIGLWDTQMGEQRAVVPGYKYVAWHPDLKHFAGAGFETAINVWNAETATLERQFLQHQHTITAIEWNPDGQFIASADANGALYIWDSQNPLNYWEMSDIDHVRNVGWKPDGSQIAVVEHGKVAVSHWQDQRGSFERRSSLSCPSNSARYCPAY